MVKLVEDLNSIPNLKISSTVAVQNLYAFALNRRNKDGDRTKALNVILKVKNHTIAQLDICDIQLFLRPYTPLFLLPYHCMIYIYRICILDSGLNNVYWSNGSACLSPNQI
jgi:hypothetical protein